MLFIKKATTAHISSIVEGNQGIASETENMILHKDTLELGVSTLINDPHLGQYWVCETETGEVCGQIMVTYEWSDWRNSQIWWIQSVYVWPDFRRRGIFKSLLARVESEAKEKGVLIFRLYAEMRNHTAHSAYQRLGFKTGIYQVFSKSINTD